MKLCRTLCANLRTHQSLGCTSRGLLFSQLALSLHQNNQVLLFRRSGFPVLSYTASSMLLKPSTSVRRQFRRHVWTGLPTTGYFTPSGSVSHMEDTLPPFFDPYNSSFPVKMRRPSGIAYRYHSAGNCGNSLA